MRWFVDVSPVGKPAPPDRYCFEAEQWQSAISQARTLRGENGAAGVEPSADGGDFRAVDPSCGIEYLASRAPDDTPVTLPPAANTPTSAPRSITQPSLQAVRELDYQVVRKRAENPSAGAPLTYREIAYAIEQRATRSELQVLLWARFREVEATLRTAPAGKFVQLAVFDHVFDHKPHRAPLATLMWKDWRGEPVLGFHDDEHDGTRIGEVRVVSLREVTRPAQADPPAATRANGTSAPAPGPSEGSESTTEPAIPSAPVIAVVAQDPDGDSVARAASGSSGAHSDEPAPGNPLKPISVDPPPPKGLKPVSVRPPPARPEGKPPGNLRPVSVRPPPAKRASVSPPSAAKRGWSVAPPADASSDDEAAKWIEPSSTPEPTDRTSGAPEEAAPTEPATTQATVREPSATSAPAPATGSSDAAPPTSEITETVAAPTVTDEAPADVSPGDEDDQPRETPPSAPPSDGLQSEAEAVDRRTEPAIQTTSPRRQPGEDLIGELFDAMHDLHFMRDMVSGAEFVLGILTRMLPSQVVLVHVFDINTRTFVVVRAKGPGTHTLILHRTADRDPFFQSAMRRSVTTRVDDAGNDDRYTNGRWSKIDCRVEATLFGPVNQGGRYLGAIELVNPEGGGPFFESEAHALDYICEQFAEFLASRPLVLEDDVVLGLG